MRRPGQLVTGDEKGRIYMRPTRKNRTVLDGRHRWTKTGTITIWTARHARIYGVDSTAIRMAWDDDPRSRETVPTLGSWPIEKGGRWFWPRILEAQKSGPSRIFREPAAKKLEEVLGQSGCICVGLSRAGR